MSYTEQESSKHSHPCEKLGCDNFVPCDDSYCPKIFDPNTKFKFICPDCFDLMKGGLYET